MGKVICYTIHNYTIHGVRRCGMLLEALSWLDLETSITIIPGLACPEPS